MKRKGSLRRISPEVLAAIYEAAIEDRETPRVKLAEELEKKLGEKSPSLDTLAKLISKARNHPPSDLDRPWSIGACPRYGIPPETVPVLIRLQELVYCNVDLFFEDLTIRKARWYAVLYPLLASMLKGSDRKLIEQILIMVFMAEQYNLRERVAQLMGKDNVDTSDLDETYFTKGDLSPEGLFINWGKTVKQLESVLGRAERQWPADVANFLSKITEGGTKQ